MTDTWLVALYEEEVASCFIWQTRG